MTLGQEASGKAGSMAVERRLDGLLPPLWCTVYTNLDGTEVTTPTLIAILGSPLRRSAPGRHDPISIRTA